MLKRAFRKNNQIKQGISSGNSQVIAGYGNEYIRWKSTFKKKTPDFKEIRKSFTKWPNSHQALAI